MNDRIPVTVSGAAGRLNAELVAVYTRDTIARPTEAPTFRNMAHAAFGANEEIKCVVVLLAGATPLLLMEVGGFWFDATGKAVTLTRVTA